jgi:hypothetical protein
MIKDELVLADIELSKVTASDLRKVLWQELADLRDGTSTPNRANAVSKLASQILDSVRLEVQSKWTRLISAQEKLSKSALVVAGQTES